MMTKQASLGAAEVFFVVHVFSLQQWYGVIVHPSANRVGSGEAVVNCHRRQGKIHKDTGCLHHRTGGLAVQC